MELRRAANDIYGRVFEQGITEALRHTANNSDDEFGPGLFDMLQVAEVRENFFFSVLANGASVNKNDVSVIEFFSKSEISIFERTCYQSRIQLVHLAPKTANVNVFHR